MRERKYFRMRSDMAQGIGFFGKRKVSCSVCKLLFFSLPAVFTLLLSFINFTNVKFPFSIFQEEIATCRSSRF